MKNKIDVYGIIVCVGWSKILELTLQDNLKKLTGIYVVTKESDKDTIRVCSKYSNVHVRYYDFLIDHSTWVHQHEKYMLRGASKQALRNWEKIKNCEIHFGRVLEKCFNKGGAIKLVQSELYDKEPGAFHMLMDSDIILGDDILKYIQGTNEENIRIYDNKSHESVLDTKLHSDVIYGATNRVNYSSLSNYKNKKGCMTDAGIAGHFMLVNSRKKHLMDEWTNAGGADVWYPFGLPPIRFTKHARLPITIHHLGEATKSTIRREFDFSFE